MINIEYSLLQLGMQYWWSNSTNPQQLEYTSILGDGDWHWLEFRYKADNSTGISAAYVDGQEIFNFSGDTILGTSPPSWTGMTHLTIGSFIYSNRTVEVAHVVVYDSSTSPTGCLTTSSFPIGLSAVQTLKPNAAGTYSQFTKPSQWSSNYSMHIGTPRSIYNSGLKTTQNNKVDTYGFDNLDGSPTIKGVCINADCYSTGDTTAYATFQTVSSGSTGSATKVLTDHVAWKNFIGEVTQDPNTSSTFTASGINAAEFGIKYTTS
jgi:hypothetical protein